MIGNLPPNAGRLIEFEIHNLPSRRAATTNQLHAKSPRRQRRKGDCFRPSSFVLRASYLPLHIGPGWLAAVPRGTQEQSERPATFSRQLQTTKIAHVEPIPHGPHGAHAWATQRLIASPQSIRLVSRPQHEHRGQIDSPSRRGWWVEVSRAIEHNESSPLAAGLAGSGQGQRSGSASYGGRQIFDQRSSPQAARWQQAIQGRRAGRSGPFILRRSARFEPSHLAAESGDERLSGLNRRIHWLLAVECYQCTT
jgi:hypothetical protein